MTTPDELADRLDLARQRLETADTAYLSAADTLEERLSDSIASINASIKTIQGAMTALEAAGAAWVDTSKPLRAELAAIAADIRALESPWTPRFPGDTMPGTIRWGQGGGNDSARAREHERVAGVPMGAWRLFYNMGQIDAAVAKCGEAITAGRLPILSMKLGDSWANVAAGRIDTALRGLFLKLGALAGPVAFIAHHEPEGGGSSGNRPDDPGGAPVWRDMQRRVRSVLNASGATNISFGPCLMVWTWTPSSGRNPEDWWVPGIWDFYAGDLYQSKEAAPAPTTQTSWLNFVAWCEAKGLPVIIGELGNRGSDATAGAELRETYEFLTMIDCVASTYFDTHLNSGPESYALVGEPLKAFRELMKDSRSVHFGQS